MQAVTDIRRQIATEYMENPERDEFSSSSNSLNARTDDCIAPIPSPKVQPNGGDALNATFLGLPSRKRTNADSHIAIRSAYELAVMIFTCSVMIPESIRVSAAEANNIPETMP